MPAPRGDDGRIRVGDRFAVSLQRTLRVPVAGGPYPLPPALGRLPIRAVAELGDRAPAAWRRAGAFYAPLYQREAVWLAFEAAWWKPNAVQVAVGGVNALTGRPLGNQLGADPQDYVVCPDQLWLDGINTGNGTVRQFVAAPLGSGTTIAEQLSGPDAAGLVLRVFEPVPGRFPDTEPERPPRPPRPLAAPVQMGLAAGGEIRQRIHPDPYGRESWDQDSASEVLVGLLNSVEYERIAGRPPPPTPVDAATYTEHGLPWFELYDERQGDIAPAAELRRVRPVAADGDGPLAVDPAQTHGIVPDGPS